MLNVRQGLEKGLQTPIDVTFLILASRQIVETFVAHLAVRVGWLAGFSQVFQECCLIIEHVLSLMVSVLVHCIKDLQCCFICDSRVLF